MGFPQETATLITPAEIHIEDATTQNLATVSAAGHLAVDSSPSGNATGGDDSDNVATVATGVNRSTAELFVFDGTNWDRVQSGTNTPGVIKTAGPAAAGTSAQPNPVILGSFAAGFVNLLNSAGDNNDAVAATASAINLNTNNRLMVFNGSTWDRVRAGSPTADPGGVGVLAAQLHVSNGATTTRVLVPNADAFSNSAGNLPCAGLVFNGSTWDRMRAGSPTAEPGNVGVLAIQLHAQNGTNIVRLRADTDNTDTLAPSATSNKLDVMAENMIFGGTSWERMRSDGTGVGRLGVGGFGVAGTPAGGVLSVQGVASMTPVQTIPGAPSAANILAGQLSHTATTAATTILTVPAGRTWVGTLTISCAVQSPAANATTSSARGAIATAGVGVTPAAGTYLACEAKNGANAATGTVGTQAAQTVFIPFIVIAPGGNSVTITGTTTIVGGGTGVVDYAAAGQLL